MSYKNIPFFWTSDGWGALIHSTGTVPHGAAILQWSHRSYVAEVEDDHLDVFLFAGEPARKFLMRTRNSPPGRAAFWGYGMWLSRLHKVPQEAIDAAAQLRKLGGALRRHHARRPRRAWEVRARLPSSGTRAGLRIPNADDGCVEELQPQGLRLGISVCFHPQSVVRGTGVERMAAPNKEGKAYVFDWVKDPTDDPFGKVLTPLPPSASSISRIPTPRNSGPIRTTNCSTMASMCEDRLW